MNLKNITGNLGAIYIFAQATYPGLSGEMIINSVLDGTIITHVLNLGLAYIAFQYGKDDGIINLKEVVRS